MSILQAIRSKSTSLLLLSLSLVCVILASVLFYVLIPRIEVRRDVSSADLIMEKIVLTTTSEMAVSTH